MPSYFNVIKQHQIMDIEHVPIRSARIETDLANGLSDSAHPLSQEMWNISRQSSYTEANLKMTLEQKIFEAEEQARQIISAAILDAEQLKAGGHLSGYEEGFRQAQSEMSIALESQSEVFDQRMSKLLKDTEQMLQTTEEIYEKHLLSLSVKIASNFVQTHMTTHDLFEPLRTMLFEMTQATKIICRLSKDDYEALSKAVSYFQDACPDSKLVMIRDLQLAKGEIKCETESQIAEYSPGFYFENLHTGMTDVRRLHNYVAV